jgi:alcohol dehydrogenase (cytochrome c)
VIRAAALLLAAGAAALAGCGSSGGKQAPVAAPAFTARQLSAAPVDNWVTNGGTLANERYSPLAQIDRSNVRRLRGAWHVSLHSGVGPQYSAEAQPLVYRGTMYVVTGADDVFAVDVDTGKVSWKHEGDLSDTRNGSVCCGWTSRGVAIGDGKVYVAQLNARLVALDQRTGKVAWSSVVAPAADDYSITSAPLYYDGRVYVGVSGGELGIRGRLTAFDARSGKLLWRFYTIPGPGQIGHDTWPATGDAWRHGGAPVWQTPAVDPRLGLLYFSTGNPGPDFSGPSRAGDNLFSASIVAVDAKTGAYRWHFQEVHHDLWDYDAPNPVVLFDVMVGGRLRHALAQAGKTGFVYILDRATGKPIFPIVERPVAQEPEQKTAATQPFPTTEPLVPQSIDSARDRGLKVVNHGRIFTPYSPRRPTVLKPAAGGGANWPPSAYSPRTGLLYVCASDSSQVFIGGREAHVEHGHGFLGSRFTFPRPFHGTLSAMDVSTGRLAWQVRLPDRCYSGLAVTAGDVLFVGRNDGHLEARDARSGKLLWRFQLGSGANNGATVFRSGGKEYVAYYAGGNVDADTKRGDDLWLFALDGKLTD